MIKEILSKLQRELNVPKEQYNSFGKYRYRSTEDILSAVKPLLMKYECSCTITDSISLVGDRYYIKATASLHYKDEDSISTSGFAREEETKKGMDASQITGTASSYARKYALNGLFAIDDTKDSDFTNRHGEDNSKKQESSPNKKYTRNYIFESGSLKGQKLSQVKDISELQEMLSSYREQMPNELVMVIEEHIELSKSLDTNSVGF